MNTYSASESFKHFGFEEPNLLLSKSFQVLRQSCSPLTHEVVQQSTNKINPSTFKLSLAFVHTFFYFQ